MEEEKPIKVVKFTCDHCGEVVESGLANIANHVFECKSATTEKLSDMFSATYYKPLSLTEINP